MGAAWQKAVLASEPPAIRPGNQLFGRELMLDSLRRTWPGLLLILLISAVVIGGGDRFLRPKSPAGAQGVDRLAVAPVAVLLVILLSWTVLFCNNLPQIAALFGFDRDGHQQYIDYLLLKKRLPLADEGWQMYQPPLFYVLSALIIGPFGWSASADSAVLALRAFSVLTGMIHLVLILLCLRLMFPNQPGRQIVGLLIAGFLPANLCLSHHVTNESLAALFVTAALYFALRLLRAETSSLRLAVAVGACLGLALLTKFSAVLALPVILAGAGVEGGPTPTRSPKSGNNRWGAGGAEPGGSGWAASGWSGGVRPRVRLALRQGVAALRESVDWQLGPPASVRVVAGPGLPHQRVVWAIWRSLDLPALQQHHGIRGRRVCHLVGRRFVQRLGPDGLPAAMEL